MMTAIRPENPLTNRLAGKLFMRAAGLLAAVLMLIGRWTPFGRKDVSVLLQPRFWLLALLVFLACSIVMGGRRRRHGAVKMDGMFLFGSTAAFLFFAMASILWSPDIAASLPKWLDLLFLLATLAVFRFFQTACGGFDFADAFWGGLLLAATALALVTLATGSLAHGDRLNVLGGGPNIFGRIMGLLCIAALAFSLSRRRKPALILFAVGVLLVVLSGSRGALLAAVAGCMTLLIVGHIRWRKVLVAFLVIAGFTGAGLLLTPLGRRAQDVFRQRWLQLTIAERHDSGRSGIYAAALDLGRKSPLFGVGLNAFAIRSGFPYPHNVFLEIFVEGGAVGLVLFLVMLGAVSRAFWRHRDMLHPASAAAFALVFTACQFSGDLYDSRGLFLLPVLAVVTEKVGLPARENE